MKLTIIALLTLLPVIGHAETLEQSAAGDARLKSKYQRMIDQQLPQMVNNPQWFSANPEQRATVIALCNEHKPVNKPIFIYCGSAGISMLNELKHR